jgi:NADPH:quinone reductase
MATHTPATMHALEMHAEDGKPESLKLVEKPVPHPASNEVLIKVAAAPINPSDVAFLRGIYGTHKRLPVIPGFEGSGTVVAAGTGILPRFYVGRRVAFVGSDGDGSWAEYAVASVMQVFPLPKDVTLEQGSMSMVNPLTALAFMEIVREGRHKAIINTAAASALGIMMLKLGLQQGLPIIHVVRRAEQVAALRAKGAKHVLNSSDADFDAALKALTHDLKATLAFDAVAGDLTNRILSAMPQRSEIIIYGGLSESAVTFDPGKFIFEGKQVSGFWLPVWLARHGTLNTGRLILKVRNLITGELSSEIRDRISLKDAARGLADYNANMSAGKVLFVPNHEV